MKTTKRKFKISWNMLFMAISTELLLIITLVLSKSNIDKISQVGHYLLIPTLLFALVTMIYWIEVYHIGEEELQEQLNKSRFSY